jgi:FkbM family methyltransferase
MANDESRQQLRLEAVEPEPLSWPSLRELTLAGKGRRLASLAVRPRGTSRRAVARDAAFKALGNLTPSFAVETEGVRVYVDTADQEISRLVYIYGLYDKPLMTLAFSALSQAGGPADLDGKRLLDLGANIGTTTLTAVASFRAEGAYCFEPDPTNFRNLEVNLAANGLAARVRAFDVAVSDADGTVTLARSATNAGDHQVLAAGEGAGGGRELVEVSATRLDALVDAGEIDLDRVGVAWLDVQGHEGQLLGGATRLLERRIPLVAEYWPAGLRAAGGHERFIELVSAAYPRFVDLGGPQGAPRGEVLPIAELEAAEQRLAGPDAHTDLLLLSEQLG